MAFDKEKMDKAELISWCGVGIFMRPVTLSWDNSDSSRTVIGYQIDVIGTGSDLNRVDPPIVPGDVIVAMKDERYGDQWIPMRAVRFAERLPDGRVPALVGPQDSQVTLRIQRQIGEEMVDVEAWRSPYDIIYDPQNPNLIQGLRKVDNGIRGCVLSQIEPLSLPKLAWAEQVADVLSHDAAFAIAQERTRSTIR